LLEYYQVTASDISIEKTTDVTEVVPGAVFTYNIEVTNAGPADVDKVTVTDTLGNHMTIFTVTPDTGSCNTNADMKGFNCTIGPLPANTSQKIIVVVLVDLNAPDMTTLMNSVNVPPGPNDDDPNNNSDVVQGPTVKVIVEDANLKIDKSSSATQVLPGEVFSYLLTVTNNGPDFADNVIVDDTILTPTLMKIIDTDPGVSTCTFSALTVKCMLGGMAPGDEELIDIIVRVDSDAVPGNILANKGDVKSDTPDSNPLDNTDTVAEPEVVFFGPKIWVGGSR